LLYALVCDKLEIQELEGGEIREILHLPKALAPYICAVLPLTNKLLDQAKTIFDSIIDNGTSVSFDTSGSIGKRYRRQDAIGTPYCITIDFDTEKDNTVTIRNRDTMQQERIKISDILDYIK
jgi:glycyl-tRNA synthetase